MRRRSSASRRLSRTGAPRVLTALLIFLATGCGGGSGGEGRRGSGSPARELHVYAAVSLTEALGEIGKSFTDSTGITLRFNFSASGTLALQIADGAPADLFLSADEGRMDLLAGRNLLVTDTRRDLLSNTLVVVRRVDSDIRISNLESLLGAGIHRVALAEPESVPAGIYARRYLESKGLWDGLASRVVPTENVRAALAAVVSGDADLAFVYKTDVMTSTRVAVAWEVSPGDGPKIVYPVAVLRASRSPAAALQFLEFLSSTRASIIFRRHGFLTNP